MLQGESCPSLRVEGEPSKCQIHSHWGGIEPGYEIQDVRFWALRSCQRWACGQGKFLLLLYFIVFHSVRQGILWYWNWKQHFYCSIQFINDAIGSHLLSEQAINLVVPIMRWAAWLHNFGYLMKIYNCNWTSNDPFFMGAHLHNWDNPTDLFGVAFIYHRAHYNDQFLSIFNWNVNFHEFIGDLYLINSWFFIIFLWFEPYTGGWSDLWSKSQ